MLARITSSEKPWGGRPRGAEATSEKVTAARLVEERWHVLHTRTHQEKPPAGGDRFTGLCRPRRFRPVTREKMTVLAPLGAAA